METTNIPFLFCFFFLCKGIQDDFGLWISTSSAFWILISKFCRILLILICYFWDLILSYRSMFFLSGLVVNVLLVNPEKAIKLAVNDQARQLMGGKKYVNLSFFRHLGVLDTFVRASPFNL